MKKIILFIFVIIAAAAFQSRAAVELGNDGYFYTALEPYGQWIELNDGVTAWQPDFIGTNWAPYTLGRWEWTADGWYWNSDEPFGYITYHYGRWYNDDYYGWIWVPDDQWAPAWVEWRYDDNYVGWAPLSPYGVFTIGVGLHFTHEYHAPYGYWNFVAYNHFCDRNVYNYYAAPSYRYRIYNETKFRTDYDYSNGRVINRGVGYDVVRERSGRPIKTREIVRVTNPQDAIRNTDRNVIKTYIATRQDITRNNVRDIDFKRSDRRTTLETSNVNLGERNSVTNNNVTREIQTPVITRTADQNRQQQIQQQNVQRQQQQRQNINQQNRQRQQQVNQQNIQRQQVRQNSNQQQRQQVNQQNTPRQQQVQQRQRADQQPRVRQQVEQKQQRTEQKSDNKDNGRERK